MSVHQRNVGRVLKETFEKRRQGFGKQLPARRLEIKELKKLVVIEIPVFWV